MKDRLIVLRNKQTKLIESIRKEKVKSMEKYRKWLYGGKGFSKVRIPNFDKRLDELKEKLALVDDEIFQILTKEIY